MSQPNQGVYKPEHEDFGKFLWNSEKGEVLGRTGTSWLKIGVFYLVYYSCLAAFFAAMMAIFLQTIDLENRPKYTNKEGSLLQNPALGYRPRPSEGNVESTLIWYEANSTESINFWTEDLDGFMGEYRSDGSAKDSRMCSFEEYLKEKDEGRRDERPCYFDDTRFFDKCTPENMWGYKEGNPCVILKLNRIIGWEPEVYETVDELPEEMPHELKEHINGTLTAEDRILPMVWLSCEGESPADDEYIKGISYSPYQGFPAFYFPYTKVAGYRSPIVAVSLNEPKRNVLISIECRVWAKNILIDGAERLGIAHFEVIID